MSDILLIYPPYISAFKCPPIGLAYLAGFVQQYGYTVKILDMNSAGIPMPGLAKFIKENKPWLIGISFMTNQFGNALKAAQISKNTLPKTSIVVGGNHISALPDEIMSYDFIFITILFIHLKHL